MPSECIVCREEQMPPTSEPINTKWVCVCGAVYRLVYMPDAGSQWVHTFPQQEETPPDDNISKAELARALQELKEVGSGHAVASELRRRFNLAPATETIR